MVPYGRTLGLVLGFCAITLVQGEALCQSGIKDMRTADPRLETPVSITTPNIYMGELLDAVATQTGVPIRVDADDGGANPIVIISVTRIRAADLMDTLWSLASFRKAEWKWSRSGEPGHYAYVFSRPAIARDLPGRLKTKMTTDFADHIGRLVRAASMTEERRRTLNVNSVADETALNSPESMSALRVFVPLSIAQIKAASTDFPFLRPCLAVQPLLSLYYRYPQILADEGMPVTAMNIAAIKEAVGGADIDWTRPMTMRVTEFTVQGQVDFTNYISFVLVAGDGTYAWQREMKLKTKFESGVSPIIKK